MRQVLCVGAAMLGLVGFGAAARATEATPRQYKIECRVVEYDWAGKKTHEESWGITTEEGRPASAFGGQQLAIGDGVRNESLEVGASLRFVVRGMNGGRVRLDASTESSWLESAPNSDPRIRSVGKRSIETIRLGKVFRIELDNGKDDGSGRAFEVTVEQADAPVK